MKAGKYVEKNENNGKFCEQMWTIIRREQNDNRDHSTRASQE